MLGEASVWKAGILIGLREEGAFGVAQDRVLRLCGDIESITVSVWARILDLNSLISKDFPMLFRMECTSIG